jgi:hypothetical protein
MDLGCVKKPKLNLRTEVSSREDNSAGVYANLRRTFQRRMGQRPFRPRRRSRGSGGNVVAQPLAGASTLRRVGDKSEAQRVGFLEGMSVLLADKLADALKKSLSLESDTGFTYLRTHGSLDTDHVAFFRSLVDSFENPETQSIIITSARIFYRLYGAIFHELGARAELSNAA